MNSAMSPWLKSQLSCSFRSSPREPKKPRSSSPPTCPSPSGHRSSPTHGSARLCSIGSPTRPTSSRPVQSPIASAEPCARRPRTKPGYSVLLPLRPSGYAPAEPNTPNINVPGAWPKKTAEVGEAKLPKTTLEIGAETPTSYMLIPSSSAEALVALDVSLGRDTEYVKAASGFRDAPASAPAFMRAERSLLSAFASWPKLVAPKKVKRIFQLRTYESPSQVAHVRKMQMFNEAEIEIFTRTGLTPVFFGDTLIGTRMPSLTYMLTFADTAELTEKWARFSADPAWKELSHKPGNTDAEIVSNISNLYLSPLSCSQI